MGLTTSELNVKIKADTSELKRGAKEAQESVKDLGKESENAASKVGKLDSESLLAGSSLVNMAQAAIGAFNKIKGAVAEFVEAGSDAVETQNVVNVAFGESAARIDEWSSDLIEKFGLSATEAKSFAGTFKTMGSSMGLANSSAEDMAITLTELAADMGSFYNASADETFQALQGIYTGSAESLRKYGIVLNQSTQEQWMLEHGIKASYTELSEAEKVAVRFGAVMEATATAQGDFERSTGSWSTQTKKLKSEWQGVKETIGNALTTVLLPFVELLSNLIKGIQKLVNYSKKYEYYALDDGTMMVRERQVEADEGFEIPDIDTSAFNGYQDMAVEAFTAAEEERLALTGAGDAAEDTSEQFKKAAKNTEKYNTATKKTQKSVNSLKRDLLGFDKLNKLSDPYSGFGDTASVEKAATAREAIDGLKQSWVDMLDAIKESPKYEAFKTAMGNVKTLVNNVKGSFNPFITSFNSVKTALGAKLKTAFEKTPIGVAFNALKTSAGTVCVNAITKLQGKMSGLTFNGKTFSQTKLGIALENMKTKITGKGGSHDTIDSFKKKLASVKFNGSGAVFKNTKLGIALTAMKTKMSGEASTAITNMKAKLATVTFGGKAFSETGLGKALAELKTKIVGAAGAVANVAALNKGISSVTFGGKVFSDTGLGKALAAMKSKITGEGGAVNTISALTQKIGGITFDGATFSNTKLGKALSDLKSRVNESGGVKDALSNVQTGITNVKGKFTETTASFSTTTFGKFLTDAQKGFNDAKTSADNSANSVTAFYKLLQNPPQMPTIVNDPTKLPTVIKPSAFASGGYPDAGSLFVAGEAGPEFVGNVGGKTGVWNSDQLISGIYNAMSRALSSAGINATINLDGRQVYKSVVRNASANYSATQNYI